MSAPQITPESDSRPVIVRFPPSPTGYLHIGSARTALYNWLYAKHTGGKMLLRIEDTDRARSTEAATQAIFDGMNWLGLTWDGDVTSQFENAPRHRAVAEELLVKGEAYKCYATADELAAWREAHPYDKFKSPWRDRTDHPADAPFSIRIKAPQDGGEMVVSDRVQGDVRVKHDELDDFIILRSDGVPTYLLAVVVDDHDMGVTHVIRGDDHLTNTFRQNLIYYALGWDLPVYAHIPMIHGDDGGKLSKRHGALSVMEYEKMGFLPEALCNYLLRLGWSHGDDELIDRDQAIAWFDLDGINKAPGRMDTKKLEHVNAHYIKEADNGRLADLVLKNAAPVIDAGTARARLIAGMDDLKSRVKNIVQLSDESHFYLKDVGAIDYDESATNILKQSPISLNKIEEFMNSVTGWSAAAIESGLKELAQSAFDGKLAEVMKPLRAALTGRTNSPSVPGICVALGRDETLARIGTAIAHAG